MAEHLAEVEYTDKQGAKYNANVSKAHSNNVVDLIYEADGEIQTAKGVPRFIKGMMGGYYQDKEKA